MAGSEHDNNHAAPERREFDRRIAPDRRATHRGRSAAGGSLEELIDAATAARRSAHAHYSKFQVGAALETTDRQIITGCNIENATYGLTLCAERVALVKALSEGHTGFARLAVVADTDTLTPPCGPCRQLLWEYCGDVEVVLANLTGASASHRLSALLPLPFDARLLDM